MQAGVRPFVKGMIILWSGTIASIPKGWALCDGNNGTPNMGSKFVFGARDGFEPGGTGGSNSHSHTVSVNPHTHNLLSAPDTVQGYSGGVGYSKNNTTSTPGGSTNSQANIPEWYCLAFIMKL